MSSAQLLRVKDGDSIVVNLNGRETEVRLYGIDAPEFGQAYGEKSTKALRKLLADHEVGIEPVTTDRYGRTVALVFADGKNVCEAMVADGRRGSTPSTARNPSAANGGKTKRTHGKPGWGCGGRIRPGRRGNGAKRTAGSSY